MRIGIHVQGFHRGSPVAAQNAIDRGAECLQIFASSPRQWRVPEIDPSLDAEMRRQLEVASLAPLFIHAPYLVNLASPTRATREMSRELIDWTLSRCANLGAAGLVVHAGQAVNSPRSEAMKHQSASICSAVDNAPPGVRFLLELTAGGSGAVASRFDQAAELLDSCGGHASVGLCLDTCHLHAAGYDISSKAPVTEMLEELDEQFGIDRLWLVHSNDSRDLRGSRRDRHWHVGEGYIGRAGFHALVNHQLLNDVPFVCETPGRIADDRRNLETLMRMRSAPLEELEFEGASSAQIE